MGVLLNPVNDVEAAIARAEILMWLQGWPNDVVLHRAMLRYEPLATQIYYEPGSFERVGSCAYRVGSTLLVFIAGASNQNHGDKIIQGYMGSYLRLPSISDPGPITHPWYALQAGDINSILQNRGLPEIDSAIISGFSAGGAIGMYLRKRLFDSVAIRRPSVVTFGSPKPSSNEEIVERQGSDICRWMNSDDPVPFIPPRIGLGQRLWLGVSVYQAERMERFTQPRGGVSISLTGVLRASDYPLGNNPPPNEAVAAWIASQSRSGDTPHSLAVYQARLMLARPPATVAPPIRTVTSGGDDPRPTPTREIQAAIVAEANTIFHDTTRRNEQPLVIPTTQLFRVAKSGRVYYVLFGGLLVTAGPTKRRARALARVGNEFLRRLQRQGKVARGDLAAQFVAYLELAGNPNSGFSPLLPVD